MLPEKLVSNFERLWTVETAKLDDQVQLAIDRRIGEYSQRGVLMSGMACQMAVTEANNSVPTRAQTALNLLTRVLSAHGIAMTEATRDDVFALLKERMLQQQQRLRGMVSGSAPFRSGILGNNAETVLSEIDRKVALELERLAGELDLMVASVATQTRALEAQRQGASAPSLVFQGPVGVVQTGPGSYGVAHQHIDQGARQALERALATLVDALAKQPEGLPFDAAEVREMVAESQAELTKDKPNTSKVRALLVGLGSTISYAPQLREAYETLKWALGFLGVTLP